MKIILTIFILAFGYMNAEYDKPDILWLKHRSSFIDDGIIYEMEIQDDTLFLAYHSDNSKILGLVKMDFDGNVNSHYKIDDSEHILKDEKSYGTSIENFVINDDYYHFYIEELRSGFGGGTMRSVKVSKDGELIGHFPKDTNDINGYNNSDFSYVFNDTLYFPVMTIKTDSNNIPYYYIYYDLIDENLVLIDTLHLDRNQLDYKISQPFYLSEFTNNRLIMPIIGPDRKNRQYSVFCKADKQLNVLVQKKVKIPGYYGFNHRQIFGYKENMIYCYGAVQTTDSSDSQPVFFTLDTNFNLLSYKVWDYELIDDFYLAQKLYIATDKYFNDFVVGSYWNDNYDTHDGKVPFGIMTFNSDGEITGKYQWEFNNGEHDKIISIKKTGNDEYIVLSSDGTLVKISLNTTSVSEYKMKGFQVYPNPTSDELTVNSVENLKSNQYICKIVSLTGETIKKYELESNLTKTSLREVPIGIYFVQIFERNNMIYSEKIIIER